MYPILFRIGSLEVTSFGVLVAAGALVGLWLFGRELRARSLPANTLDVAIAGLFGGIVGAKLLFVAEHLGEEPFLDLLLDRSGLSWFGGFAGGIGLGIVMIHHRRLPLVAVLAASTPALAVGQMFGRLGCFLVGDDYGRPTSLPWGVAFPEGLPPITARVHPTQLYEAALLALIAALLVGWRRHGLPDRLLLARYFLLAGTVRFAVEFIRVNTRVLLGLTVAQFASLALFLTGLALSFCATGKSTANPGTANRNRHPPLRHS